MKRFKVNPDDFVKVGGAKNGCKPEPRWEVLWDLQPGEAVETWSEGEASAASVSLSLAKRRGRAPAFVKCGRLKDGRTVYYNPGE